MKRAIIAALAVLLLTSCVGYIHLGGRKSRPDVYIGMDGQRRTDAAPKEVLPPPPSTGCPPYVFIQPAPLGNLPEFDGTEPEKEVIERLGRALMRTRSQYSDYARASQENYQAYLMRCAAAGTPGKS